MALTRQKDGKSGAQGKQLPAFSGLCVMLPDRL